MAEITNIVLQSSANIVSEIGAKTYTNIKFDANSLLGSITYTNIKFDVNSVLGSLSYTNVKFDGANSVLGSRSFENVGVFSTYKVYKENW